MLDVCSARRPNGTNPTFVVCLLVRFNLHIKSSIDGMDFAPGLGGERAM